MTMDIRPIDVSATISGREEIHLHLLLTKNDQISEVQIKAVGGPDFLREVTLWSGKICGDIHQLPLPRGAKVSDMLLRKVFLLAKQRWQPPYKDEELCHCRMVPTEVVNAAIVCGAHSVTLISEWTSASTSCGTCRPDAKAQLAYWLNPNSNTTTS